MKHKKATVFAAVAAAAVLTLSITAFAAAEPAPEPEVEAEAVESTFVFDEEAGEATMYSVDGDNVEEVTYELDFDSGVLSENGNQIGTIEKDADGHYVMAVESQPASNVAFSVYETDDGFQAISVAETVAEDE